MNRCSPTLLTCLPAHLLPVTTVNTLSILSRVSTLPVTSILCSVISGQEMKTALAIFVHHAAYTKPYLTPKTIFFCIMNCVLFTCNSIIPQSSLFCYGYWQEIYLFIIVITHKMFNSAVHYPKNNLNLRI